MSMNPEFRDTFIEETDAFVKARFDYALGDIPPVTLFSAQEALDTGKCTPEQDSAIQQYTDRYEEYEGLAFKQFASVNGYFLRWVDLGELDLTNNSKTSNNFGPKLMHVSLITEVDDGGIKINKVNHAGSAKQELAVTAEDCFTIVEAVMKLGVIRNILSEL